MYNVVVIVNGGKNIISRKLLDELAAAAGAETWECVDLPAESRKVEKPANTGLRSDDDNAPRCIRCSNTADVHPSGACHVFVTAVNTEIEIPEQNRDAEHEWLKYYETITSAFLTGRDLQMLRRAFLAGYKAARRTTGER